MAAMASLARATAPGLYASSPRRAPAPRAGDRGPDRRRSPLPPPQVANGRGGSATLARAGGGAPQRGRRPLAYRAPRLDEMRCDLLRVGAAVAEQLRGASMSALTLSFGQVGVDRGANQRVDEGERGAGLENRDAGERVRRGGGFIGADPCQRGRPLEGHAIAEHRNRGGQRRRRFGQGRDPSQHRPRHGLGCEPAPGRRAPLPLARRPRSRARRRDCRRSPRRTPRSAPRPHRRAPRAPARRRRRHSAARATARPSGGGGRCAA